MSSRRRKSSTDTQAASRAFVANGPYRMGCLIFPGASAYDLAVAAEVVSTANNQIRRDFGVTADTYTFEVISSAPGPVKMEMGLKILPDATIADWKDGDGLDTLFISGGCWEPIEASMRSPELVNWLRRVSLGARRVAAMCTGSFLLAQAGVLHGAATTHWAHCERLGQLFPKLEIQSDHIFVKSGKIYSSAGSTAAMDLVLALIEEDLGRNFAMSIARGLVMFLKRAGGQSQFSTALKAQSVPSEALNGVPEWIIDHLDADLSVEKLAARAAMSPRNFARVFVAETGLTPARYVEQARVEKARGLMDDTQLALGAIAAKAGFENDRQMRRAFLRWLKVTPSDYIARFRGAAADNAYIAKGRKARSEEEAQWVA